MAHRLQSNLELLHLVLGPLDTTPLPGPVPPLRLPRLRSRARLSAQHKIAIRAPFEPTYVRHVCLRVSQCYISAAQTL